MKSRLKKLLIAGAALAALALGGSALAGAATTGSTGTTGATGATTTSPPMRANFPGPGSAAHEDSETAVTGADATKAQAAAVASVGSGTAGSVTTNFDKTGYEVTVTKSDGTTVEVHTDLSFKVQTMPAGPGGPGHYGPGPQFSSPGPLA